MGRRKQPQTLKVRCIISLAKNMEKIWCAEYYKNYHDQGNFLHVLGPFQCLTPDLIQKLINCLVARNKMKRYFLNCLIDSRLENLDLSICRKASNKDSIISLVGIRCQKLTRLNIASCSNITPRTLADLVAALPNVMSLKMKHTKCTDQVLAQIGQKCKHLRELDLYGCPVTDMGIMSLCVSFDPAQPKVDMLYKLDVAFTGVTHKGVELILKNCKNMQFLHYPDICDAIYQMWQRNEGNTESLFEHNLLLRTLYLSLMKETNSDPDESVQITSIMCPGITDAYIHNGVTDKGLAHLCNLKQLRVLHLSNSHGDEITFEGGLLPLLTSHGKHLEELILSEINFVDIGVVGFCCPNLKKFTCLVAGFPTASFPVSTQPELVHSQTSQSSTHVVPFQYLEELKILIYTDENNFPPQFVRLLLLNSECLRELHLSNVNCFDDELFCQILEKNKLQKLQMLSFEKINKITLDPIYDFCETENSLKFLELKFCQDITRIDREQLEMLVAEDNLDLSLSWS